MSDVAKLAGVGIKTVSRVINGEPNVSEATSARVLAAVKQLDYRQDIYAGNLRRGGSRTQTLGLLVSSVANPFASVLHRAVEEMAAARGVATFAASLDDNPENERRMVDAFVRRRVDGLILTTIAPDQGYLWTELGRGTPMVFVDRIPANITADTVVCDNEEGAASAVRHLIAHGHRRIAYMGDLAQIRTAKDRYQGYVWELNRAGLPIDESIVVHDLHNEESATDAARRLFSGDHPPTAVFSAQNLITIGLIRALRELGLNHEVAIVGFDDVALADLLDPPVTVVAQDPYRIGEVAAERLFARLDDDTSPPKTIVIPTRLVVRGSGEIAPRHP
ncbi:LacI family DNA-binding transcriptional regulator [Oerskovia sp. NPDC060338]|uniref:LacI family DNA-binding transcriptional regulator n=1 Tax=Oerskovia sp. NPDC060338 TaxID=3347100 RepID=UPI00365CA924